MSIAVTGFCGSVKEGEGRKKKKKATHTAQQTVSSSVGRPLLAQYRVAAQRFSRFDPLTTAFASGRTSLQRPGEQQETGGPLSPIITLPIPVPGHTTQAQSPICEPPLHARSLSLAHLPTPSPTSKDQPPRPLQLSSPFSFPRQRAINTAVLYHQPISSRVFLWLRRHISSSKGLETPPSSNPARDLAPLDLRKLPPLGSPAIASPQPQDRLESLRRTPSAPQSAWRQASACTTQGNSDSMHPLSVLSLGIFVAGYITARWDLVTRLYELAIFAWNYGVVVGTSLRRPQPHTLLTSSLSIDPRCQRLCAPDLCIPPRLHSRGTLGHEGVEPGTTNSPDTRP